MSQHDDTEAHTSKFHPGQPTTDDTQGNTSNHKFVEPEGVDDTDGNSVRTGHLDEDTEGSGMRFPEAPDLEDDDVAGHIRMTDDQLAAGLTPSEVTTKSSPRDPSGPPRN
ncbi:MAG: hypothetical protein QOI95_3339 [Acidimicrobiaceae bacterium]|jgi:hypothetical protein